MLLAIYGPDGKVHVFYSRWKKDIGFGGWLTACEIAHAVGDKPEGPFKTSDIALAPRGGDWWMVVVVIIQRFIK